MRDGATSERMGIEALVPQPGTSKAALAWYNTHRSHSSLGRITPDEQYLAALPPAHAPGRLG